MNEAYTSSKIRIESNSLGQSAHQIYCLILHLPFIFINHKDILPDEIWDAMMHLISIIRIVFSHRVEDSDLAMLDDCVQKFLLFILSADIKLTPKHHMLTHYSGVIKRMGPLIKMWMVDDAI